MRNVKTLLKGLTTRQTETFIDDLANGQDLVNDLKRLEEMDIPDTQKVDAAAVFKGRFRDNDLERDSYLTKTQDFANSMLKKDLGEVEDLKLFDSNRRFQLVEQARGVKTVERQAFVARFRQLAKDVYHLGLLNLNNTLHQTIQQKFENEWGAEKRADWIAQRENVLAKAAEKLEQNSSMLNSALAPRLMQPSKVPAIRLLESGQRTAAEGMVFGNHDSRGHELERDRQMAKASFETAAAQQRATAHFGEQEERRRDIGDTARYNEQFGEELVVSVGDLHLPPLQPASSKQKGRPYNFVGHKESNASAAPSSGASSEVRRPAVDAAPSSGASSEVRRPAVDAAPSSGASSSWEVRRSALDDPWPSEQSTRRLAARWTKLSPSHLRMLWSHLRMMRRRHNRWRQAQFALRSVARRSRWTSPSLVLAADSLRSRCMKDASVQCWPSRLLHSSVGPGSC